MKGFRWIVVGGVLIGLVAGIGCRKTSNGKKRPAKTPIAVESHSSTEAKQPPADEPTVVAPPVFVTPNLPAGATLLDPDMVWDRQSPDSLALSPDEQWIAYVSQGAIWLCRVTGGPPTKLIDLPNTVTECQSRPSYRRKRVFFNQLDSGVDPNSYYGHFAKGPGRVVALKWTPSQDGVFYTLENKKKKRFYTRTYRIMHVSTKGIATKLATIVRDSLDKPEHLWRFDVSHDRSKVVASGYRPIIWDTATDKPLVTPFDYLIPSSTSGRFLGIEIDTRQLVITDENLEIEKRLDVTFNSLVFPYAFWSPDERFAIGVARLQHIYPPKWTGFRVDLETGKQRLLDDGHFFTRLNIEEHIFDQFVFTGRGGEIIRAGRIRIVRGGYADGRNGSYVSLVPDGEGPRKDICQFSKPPRRSRTGDRITKNPYPPIRLSRDGSLFAMAFPRKERKRGHRYWLFDREGNKWPMGPDDPTLCASPYHVIALADNGKQVIAYDGVQLFSIPVATIQSQAKEAKDE